MLYNVRIKTYPDGHKQYFWSENSIFRLDEDNDSPELVERVKRRRKNRKLMCDLLSSLRVDDDVEVDDASFLKSDRNLRRSVNEVYDIARSNEFNWFITLTFSPKVVNRYDYASCSDIVKKFTDRLRKYGCKSLLVPEQHEDGAYHFHGLVHGDLPLIPSGKMWYNEVEGYEQPVYNVANYDFGWTTATEIVHPDRCATYVTKYLVKKPAVPKGKKCYWASKSLARPTVEFISTFEDIWVPDSDMPGGYRIVREHDAGWGFGFPTGVRYIKEIESEYGRFIISEE